ncbi:hypothetical protein DBL07_25815 [Achromobacter mucicolens]|nr:hypothetical protein DBL07_25815 [Achromobacter mucicolens]
MISQFLRVQIASTWAGSHLGNEQKFIAKLKELDAAMSGAFSSQREKRLEALRTRLLYQTATAAALVAVSIQEFAKFFQAGGTPNLWGGAVMLAAGVLIAHYSQRNLKG